MFDISTPSEALELLEKEDFSISEARAILLYLIERDERWKANGNKINAAFLALFEIAGVMMEVLPHLPLTPEVKSHLEHATDAITELHDLIKPDLLVH